jgi:hypothetical protein
MAIVTGEVVQNSDGTFKAVFKHDGITIGECPVASKEEGEAWLVEALRELAQRAAEDANAEGTDAQGT